MATKHRCRLAAAAAAALAILGLAALPGAAPAQETPRRHLSIVAPSALFPLLVAAGERFALDSSNEMPVVEPLGTETGIALLCAGEGARHPDIVASVRRLTRGDLGACAAKGIGISELLVGHQAVALAQNPGPAPLSLTARQLFLALAREVPVNGRLVANPYRLWSDIDFALPVKPIAVLGPPPGSRLHDSFAELVMARSATGFPALRGRDAGALRDDGVFVTPGDEDASLDDLRRRADAIAIVGFNRLARQGAGLLPVPLDGIAPGPAAIADG
ncbi:MAG TPA: substrate-binding domain-containing protein, partial [Kiloniellaceae bacterium]|nr:substrate-binding domain-containing protein [Kiloniellaceae bacterium]